MKKIFKLMMLVVLSVVFSISLFAKDVVYVGTNAEFSFNRFLCQYIAKRYGDKFNIEVCEINDLPLFSKDDYPNEAVQNFRKKITSS